MQAGLPNFVLSPGQWVEKTNAIGIYVKQGKYGGTFAHKDIAFEFGAAISAVFRLLLIKEFQLTIYIMSFFTCSLQMTIYTMSFST
jgi:hypothetical protein